MEIHEILALMLTIYMGVSESLCKRNLKRCRSNELCGMYRCLVGSREWVRFCDSEQSINHGLNCPSSPTSNRIYRSNSLPRWWQYNYSQDCGGQKCSNTAATKQQRKGIQDNRSEIDWQLNDLMSSKINDALDSDSGKTAAKWITYFHLNFRVWIPLSLAVHKRCLSPSLRSLGIFFCNWKFPAMSWRWRWRPRTLCQLRRSVSLLPALPTLWGYRIDKLKTSR